MTRCANSQRIVGRSPALSYCNCTLADLSQWTAPEQARTAHGTKQRHVASCRAGTCQQQLFLCNTNRQSFPSHPQPTLPRHPRPASPIPCRTFRLQPDVPDTPIDVVSAFKLHSRPSAVKKILLDFDGHTTSNTQWNVGRAAALITPPYDKVRGFILLNLDTCARPLSCLLLAPT